MTAHIPEDVVARLVAWAEGRPAIAEMWLFGSPARGDHHATSDIDVAIRLTAPGSVGLGSYTAKADLWLSELRASAQMQLSLELLGYSDKLDVIVSREGVLLWKREA